LFDIFYPGQYRRRIRAVRLTIPCVTGPFTNVGATLTLTASSIRNQPQLGAQFLLDVPIRRTVSVATSTAQNDAGVFEFSFRDERYMPFEGAGAISAWTLSLPSHFRPFDYQTITDVILHVSYTAEHDGLFREQVEQQNAALEGAILNILSSVPSARVLSMRQDFSTAFHRFLHSPASTTVRFEISDAYLPIFLKGRAVQVTRAVLALRTPPSQTVGAVQIAFDGAAQSGFTRDTALGNLWAATMPGEFSAGLLGQHTLIIEAAGDLAPAQPAPDDPSAIDAQKLLDVVIYVEYRLQ
jgi:hypothetical protein